MKVEISVYFYTENEFSGNNQYWRMNCPSAFPGAVDVSLAKSCFFGEELLGQEDGGDQVRGGLGFKRETGKGQVSTSLPPCKCLIGYT